MLFAMLGSDDDTVVENMLIRIYVRTRIQQRILYITVSHGACVDGTAGTRLSYYCIIISHVTLLVWQL